MLSQDSSPLLARKATGTAAASSGLLIGKIEHSSYGSWLSVEALVYLLYIPFSGQIAPSVILALTRGYSPAAAFNGRIGSTALANTSISHANSSPGSGLQPLACNA